MSPPASRRFFSPRRFVSAAIVLAVAGLLVWAFRPAPVPAEIATVARGRRITIAATALYCCIAGLGAVGLYLETHSLLVLAVRIAIAALVAWGLVSGRRWMRALLIGILIVTNARKAVLALNEPPLFIEVGLALVIVITLAFSPSVQAFFARPHSQPR